MKNPMYPDFARKTFKWPGTVGALVQAGASSGKSHPGIGDCVLLNFESGLFALSDSSDRDPGWSRKFLLRFDRMISSFPGIRLDREVNYLEIPGIAEKLDHECRKILEAMRGPASCTLTSILLLKTDTGMNALIFHTGDSCLYEYDIFSRELSTLVMPNFWMVGKTVKLFQITEFKIKPQVLFILSTDGVPTLSNDPAKKRSVAQIIQDSRVEEIPDRIMDMGIPAGSGFRDDAALIALSTVKVKPAKKRIVIGGVRNRQEAEYIQRLATHDPSPGRGGRRS